MSTHRGVSCDKCGKSGFTGKRYKCLLCFDFDFCADCYESLGEETANNGRHTSTHPMQCILTRADMSLYYGGENSADFAYSFTCPFCSLPGFTEQTLFDHVTALHAEQRTEIICPICAALPDGDANFVSDDFHEHLAIEHQVVREVDESSQRLIRRIHQRGGRTKGHHRLYASSGSYQQAGSLFNAGYVPRKERGSGFSQHHGADADPLADLLSQLTTSHRETGQLHPTGMPHYDTLNEERFEHLAKQYSEYSKYSLNQFSDKPADRSSFLYRSLADTHVGKGGRERFRGRERDLIQHPPHKEVSKQIREMSKESEEKKEAFDMKRAQQGVFVSELLISSMSKDFVPNPDYSDDPDL